MGVLVRTLITTYMTDMCRMSFEVYETMYC